MTPLEELEAAHARLSGIRDAVNAKQIGTYWGNIDEDPHDRAEVFCAHGVVAETVSNEHADLIVMLHRTIDAQLSMLDMGIAEQALLAERWGIDYGETTTHDLYGAVGLARAING
ncbi:hypothetical protein QP735_04290 [Curtobacterium citreum]|uniref:hypothetical protein n=1 Tax=Curtobacterium citreum TaxID=2036 RepID=UPI00254B46CD|nr:hypothetical protein [Curtobacterium citreum]MDK8171743.1 hypothetical protein [Curtobacterium citreum]